MTSTQKAYQDYLQTDIWRTIRAQRLAVDNNQCVLCGEEASHVHHRRYPKEWGKETVNDLVSLCSGCHKKHHEQQAGKYDSVVEYLRSYNKNISRLPGVEGFGHLIHFLSRFKDEIVEETKEAIFDELFTEYGLEHKDFKTLFELEVSALFYLLSKAVLDLKNELGSDIQPSLEKCVAWSRRIANGCISMNPPEICSFHTELKKLVQQEQSEN